MDSFAQLGFEVWSLEFANCNLDKALFTSRARATRLIAPRAVFGRPVIGPSRATLCASVRRICWPARVWRQLARVLADSAAAAAAALSKLGPTMRLGLGLGLGMKIKFRIKIHTNRSAASDRFMGSVARFCRSVCFGGGSSSIWPPPERVAVCRALRLGNLCANHATQPMQRNARPRRETYAFVCVRLVGPFVCAPIQTLSSSLSLKSDSNFDSDLGPSAQRAPQAAPTCGPSGPGRAGPTSEERHWERTMVALFCRTGSRNNPQVLFRRCF